MGNRLLVLETSRAYKTSVSIYRFERNDFMYCQECGKDNQGASAGSYCEFCGTQLAASAVAKAPPKPKGMGNIQMTSAGAAAISKLKSADVQARANAAAEKAKSGMSQFAAMSKKTKALVISAGVLVVLAFVTLGVLTQLSSPKHIATAYFKAMAKGDYKAAFNYISLPKSEFVSKDSFIAYMSQQQANAIDYLKFSVSEQASNSSRGIGDIFEMAIKGDLAEYQARKKEAKEQEKMLKNYRVSYTQTGSSSAGNMDIVVVKAGNKWRVGVDGILVQNYNVIAPLGMNLSMDGKVLSGREATDYDEEQLVGMAIYTVPVAIPGNHKFQYTSELYEDGEFSSRLDRSNETMYLTRDVDLELKAAVQEQMNQIAVKVYPAIVNAAISGQEIDSIEGIRAALTTDPEKLNGIKSRFDSLKSSVRRNDGTGLKSIAFKQIVYNDSAYRNGVYQCEFDFSYSYVKLETVWGQEGVQEVPSSSDRNDSGRFSFAYEDGAWKIISFDNGYSIYYY